MNTSSFILKKWWITDFFKQQSKNLNKIVYSTSKIENKTRKRELYLLFSELKNIQFCESYGSLKLSKNALKYKGNEEAEYFLILKIKIKLKLKLN